MRNRTQAFLLAATASFLFSACGQQSSLLAGTPSAGRHTYTPDSEATLPFDEALDLFLEGSESETQSISVSNQTHILMDCCLLTGEQMDTLLTGLRDSKPAAPAEKLTVANRSYTIEWTQGERVIRISSGSTKSDKCTIILVDDNVYCADRAVYTQWVDSFASLK